MKYCLIPILFLISCSDPNMRDLQREAIRLDNFKIMCLITKNAIGGTGSEVNFSDDGYYCSIYLKKTMPVRFNRDELIAIDKFLTLKEE